MRFTIETQGHYDFLDITEQAGQAVAESNVKNGLATIFVVGSTAAVTTMENEDGLKQDLTAMLERWAPEQADYEHHMRWGDHNGAAHMKAAIIGPSVTVPIENGRLALGTWQQVFLIDFDERPRSREVIVTAVAAAAAT